MYLDIRDLNKNELMQQREQQVLRRIFTMWWPADFFN